MKKNYEKPEVELFAVSLQGVICESNLYPDSIFDNLNDPIDFIW